MSKLMDAIDLRTQLVGENRLELLTFHLNGPQLFAMNVFKIQEVQRMPKISVLPHSHEMILGVTHARGHTIPIVDLARAIRLPPITDIKNANIIIAEYNMSVQGFMVGSVDRIVNMKWNEVSPPPKGSGKDHYLTAITRLQDRIVEIIDVEKILAEVKFFNTQISEGILQDNVKDLAKGLRVLIVDDSTVGLRQVRHVMEQLGVEIYTATNGNLALGLLNRWVQEGFDFKNNFLMMVTDAEMPEMDGYRLT
ncbi:MAG: chemotaxis protein, partial [Pseudomonadota bacterium]